MIFKYLGKKDSGRGTEAAKRMITSHLNHRPNQGQKRPGQMDDLRKVIADKKAKRDTDRKSGEKAMYKGKSSQSGASQWGASQSGASQSSASQSGASRSGASQSDASQSGAGGKTYNFSNATFHGNVTINN